MALRSYTLSSSTDLAPLRSFPHFLFVFQYKIATLSLSLSASSSSPLECPVQLKRKNVSNRMTSSSSASQSKLTAPYGSWKSPISADLVSGASKLLAGTAVDALGRLIFLESRPSQSGRMVLVRASPKYKDQVDITPEDYSVRTVAMGSESGGAFSVSGDTVIFSNYQDQRLYKKSMTSADSCPVPVTPDYGGPVVCYADGVFDRRFNRYVTVREDFRESSLNSTTTIVAVGLDGYIREPEVLVAGNDFYAFPRMDPKGKRMAWIEWSHPNMPWDEAQLWVGYIADNGEVHKRVCVAGNEPRIRESPTEPKWSSKGELFFITDRHNGFWNLYRWAESNNEVISACSLDAEFSRPLWNFGMNSYEFIQSYEGKNLIACSYRKSGRSYLGILDDVEGSLSLLSIPFTDINNITLGFSCLYVEGASEVHPLSVAKVILDDLKSKAVDFKILWSCSPDCLKYESYFSLPKFIEFPTEVPGKTAFAFFYPPSNSDYQATIDEKPPLLLGSHGGPTFESRGILNLSIQYWTSRGWAFVDVNYGGSTGYGREYRERLLGKWGIVDVNDCCSCARYLVDSGMVDGERLCATGESAGGYTTLAALAFRDTFKAGASLYGIADLRMLKAEETHKFESRYIDNLVGTEKEYFDRSPINFVDKFSSPIILFQGLEDMSVPPKQARTIYHTLKEKGLPVALVEYEGEGHGFRKAENIKFTLEQQMVFFARLVGHFKAADEITPIKIDNFV